MKKENLHTTDCIRTNSGLYMNVFEPTMEMISIEDIAHALSNNCRFGGHLDDFYSVAQHSWHCSQLVSNENAMAALMHDASEAYLLDIPRPIKQRLSEYKEIEHRLMLLIAEKFQFEYPFHKEIKEVDNLMLEIEWDNLMLKQKTKDGFVAFQPYKAKQYFLRSFYDIEAGLYFEYPGHFRK